MSQLTVTHPRVIDRVTPVKVRSSVEEHGLDADLHGEEAYTSDL